MIPLRTSPDRIAELRALCEYKKKNSQQARDTLDTLSDLIDLTAENERLRAEVAAKDGEIGRLNGLINTPHTDDWFEAVRLEAAHQVERYGVDHDRGKTPFDWFWLIGYLAQKAASAGVAGDDEKAKHHTVSTGAALFNWFRYITGDAKLFQPGVDALVKEEA